MTPVRRLLARATARCLTVFVIPDADIARMAGLDLSAIDRLEAVATPRHANTLLIVGPTPPGLARASAVAYAQMPRPRWIVAVDIAHIDGLPDPDVVVQPSQASLLDGIARLRRMIADGGFRTDVAEFELAAVRARTVFVCPMHPRIVQDTPGSCPICGMDLVQQEIAEDAVPAEQGPSDGVIAASSPHEREADAGGFTCPMHPEIVRTEPGSCPICGMTLVPRADETIDSAAEHGSRDTSEPTEHLPPVDPDANHAHHPTAPTLDAPRAEAEQQRPGIVDRSAREDAGHGARPSAGGAGHPTAEAGAMGAHTGHSMDAGASHSMGGSSAGMGGMDHGGQMAGGFMSMVEITRDLPRSADGLPMDWIEVPFGPLFPGLPGGLTLMLTLDGDTVATADIRQGATSRQAEAALPGRRETLPERIASLDRLAPGAYAALAWRAVAGAGGLTPDDAGLRACVGVLERARALSHLGWLSAFGRLLGYRWLEEQAGNLCLGVTRAADVASLAPARDGIHRLVERVERTQALHQRLSGIGVIPADGYGDWLTGPVARAAALENDARVADPTYRSFGFAPVTRSSSDALARLEVRLHELIQSLDLLQHAGTWRLPTPIPGPDPAEMTAALEMPRGEASIRVTLDQGEVSAVQVSVPSSMHVDMTPVVAESVELADSLVAIASLDISPWELDQ